MWWVGIPSDASSWFLLMEQYLYTIEELRASVEEGTRQVERGQYYTDAQVDYMLEQRNRQLA